MTKFRCQTCNETLDVPAEASDPAEACTGGHIKVRRPLVGAYVIQGDTKVLDVDYGEGWVPFDPE